MNDTSFHRLAIDSARKYLSYLEREDKGIIKTKVTSITKRSGTVYLHLRGRLSPVGIDALRLRIYADEYSDKVIHPIEYHSVRNVLVLRPKEEFYSFLPSGKCDHISVISDLRFLVERVYDWYMTSRPTIRLPRLVPDVTPPALIDMAGGVPTQEQYAAVCNVLTTPFSYVWGAPGTGKTRLVLANCVLAYLRADKKVLLAAPTNNALEQMLFGILNVIQSCGISTHRVLRLGVPSEAFAAQYPESCEHLAAENRRLSIVGELTSLAHQQQDTERLAALLAAQSSASGFYERLREVSDQFRTSTVSGQELTAARAAADQAQKAMDALEQTTQELSIWLESLPGRAARFFRPALYSEKSALLKSSARKLEDAVQVCTEAANRYSSLEEKARAATQRYYAQLEELCQQYTDTFKNPPIPELSIPVEIPLDKFPSFLSRACDAIREALERAPVLDENNLDISEIRRRIHTLKNELAQLDADHQSKWAGVRVIAMTIDRFIAPNGSPSDFDPEHVFMDEAAYCSLIKGYTLLSLGCPVTLLGDHAQLPPVCEMNEHDLQYSFRPEFLWAQSAVYLDSIFHLSDSGLHNEYKNMDKPGFCDLQLNPLSITHRFGPGLSRVLSDFIYEGALTSARTDETDIRCIHAPSSPTDKNRTSEAECSAIKTLANSPSFSETDFAILTPYKNQVALLSKSMPGFAAAGKIMTIHASQGREFHTVILSVVDTANMFFTDSRNPIGRAVLNTAISRVKSDLILVLDYDYWHTQKRQLIGQLLGVAKCNGN